MKDINLFEDKNSLFFRKIKSKKDLAEEDSCDGYLIESPEKEARKIITSLGDKKSKKKIALVGGDDTFNRRAIETLKIDYLISPEKKTLPGTLKQRDSGLNHVTSKIAKEKRITILVDFSEISYLSGKEKAIRLGKIIQNINLCKKSGCKIGIASFAKKSPEVIDEKSRRSFGISLGMSSSQAKDSTLF